MDVTSTFNALRASARAGQVFPAWWCLSDPTAIDQARAYCQAYTPFYRHNTWGIELTRQVVRFTLPEPRSQKITEASANAIGFALLDQLGLGRTGKRTGISDKEERTPYYLDMLRAELVVLDGADTLLQRGSSSPRLRRREVLWLQNLFNQPSYKRPEPLSRVLGNKQGLSIPVIVLCDSTMCQLLAQMEVAVTPESDQTSLLLPKQVDVYGPPAEAGTLSFQDLNQLRAYLRLPRLLEETVELQAYSTDRAGSPVFGIARYQGRQVFFKAIENSVDETGKERQTRYVLLEATAQLLEESMKRAHHLHPGEVQNQAVIGWFEKQDAHFLIPQTDWEKTEPIKTMRGSLSTGDMQKVELQQVNKDVYFLHRSRDTDWQILVKQDGSESAYQSTFRVNSTGARRVAMFTLLPAADCGSAPLMRMKLPLAKEAGHPEREAHAAPLTIESDIPAAFRVEEAEKRILVTLRCRLESRPDEHVIIVEPDADACIEYLQESVEENRKVWTEQRVVGRLAEEMEHSDEEPSESEQRAAALARQGLKGARSLTRHHLGVFGVLAADLLLLCTGIRTFHTIPSSLRGLAHDAARLTDTDAAQFGTALRADYEQHDGWAFSTFFNGKLFWEAISHVFAITHEDSSLWEYQAAEQNAAPLRRAHPRLRQALAQDLINGAFLLPTPPQEESVARIQVALALDSACSDAYLAQGSLAAGAGLYAEAQRAYEQAMELAAARLGLPLPASTEQIHPHQSGSWQKTDLGAYTRPRRALAFLLWQRLGKPAEAIVHFQALADLQPDGLEDVRQGLLCCLLEAGDTRAVGRALEDSRSFKSSTGDLGEVYWWYSYVLWLFRGGDPDRQAGGKQQAAAALRMALKRNRHVAPLLLARHDDPALQMPTEEVLNAMIYTSVAQRAWQNTPGALEWLEEAL